MSLEIVPVNVNDIPVGSLTGAGNDFFLMVTAGSLKRISFNDAIGVPLVNSGDSIGKVTTSGVGVMLIPGNSVITWVWISPAAPGVFKAGYSVNASDLVEETATDTSMLISNVQGVRVLNQSSIHVTGNGTFYIIYKILP